MKSNAEIIAEYKSYVKHVQCPLIQLLMIARKNTLPPQGNLLYIPAGNMRQRTKVFPENCLQLRNTSLPINFLKCICWQRRKGYVVVVFFLVAIPYENVGVYSSNVVLNRVADGRGTIQHGRYVSNLSLETSV